MARTLGASNPQNTVAMAGEITHWTTDDRDLSGAQQPAQWREIPGARHAPKQAQLGKK
jgi:hypothetical protein